jgi:hypothetical protein
MDTIIASVITGIFSLMLIKYQHQLTQKTKKKRAPASQLSSEVAEEKSQSSSSSKYSIIVTVLITVLPLGLSFVLGKDFFGGDDYLSTYYFIWTFVTLIAIFIGWKQKKLFEKVLLIVSCFTLLSLGIFVSYEMKRNRNYPESTISGGDQTPSSAPADTTRMQP